MIRTSYFSTLLEQEYSCVMLSIPDDMAEEIQAWAKENIPPEDLTDEGFEDETHVTVLYGLSTDSPDDVRGVLDTPIEATLKGVSYFECPDYDVVKVDVESPDLIIANARLRSLLSHTMTHAVYSPHVTIAYVKKGRRYPEKNFNHSLKDVSLRISLKSMVVMHTS